MRQQLFCEKDTQREHNSDQLMKAQGKKLHLFQGEQLGKNPTLREKTKPQLWCQWTVSEKQQDVNNDCI